MRHSPDVAAVASALRGWEGKTVAMEAKAQTDRQACASLKLRDGWCWARCEAEAEHWVSEGMVDVCGCQRVVVSALNVCGIV